MGNNKITEFENITDILYRQVELLAEDSEKADCSPEDLRENTNTILNIYKTFS